jgi:transcriptional regulator with XRE-family HTH domain
MPNSAKRFAVRLANALQASGLPKATICRRAGISRPTLDRYLETGLPGLADAEALASALDVSVDQLIGAQAPEHDLSECARRVTEAALSAQRPPEKRPQPLPDDGLTSALRSRGLSQAQINVVLRRVEAFASDNSDRGSGAGAG